MNKNSYDKDLFELHNEWNQNFDLRENILDSNNLGIAWNIYCNNILSPLSVLGMMEKSLILGDIAIEITSKCMADSLNFITYPFPNSYYEYKTNDCIGQIFLKPLCYYKINSNFNELNGNIDWILIGFVYLFKAIIDLFEEAFDSLATLAICFEKNKGVLIEIIEKYISDKNQDTYENYCKMIVSLNFLASEGYKTKANKINLSNEHFKKMIFFFQKLEDNYGFINNQEGFDIAINEGFDLLILLNQKILLEIEGRIIDIEHIEPPILNSVI